MNEDVLFHGNENKTYLYSPFSWWWWWWGGVVGVGVVVVTILWMNIMSYDIHIENINANGVSFNQPKSGENMKKIIPS